MSQSYAKILTILTTSINGLPRSASIMRTLALLSVLRLLNHRMPSKSATTYVFSTTVIVEDTRLTVATLFLISTQNSLWKRFTRRLLTGFRITSKMRRFMPTISRTCSEVSVCSQQLSCLPLNYSWRVRIIMIYRKLTIRGFIIYRIIVLAEEIREASGEKYQT